jgi:hypothetical protein
MPEGASLFNNVRAVFVGTKKILAMKLVTLICCLTLFFTILIPYKAHACGLCIALVGLMDVPTLWDKTQGVLDEYINDEYMELEDYILRMIWMENVLPAMMLSAEQLTAVAIQQVMAIGMFLDAETQMSSQRLLQEIQAQTHKDFRPSEGLCEFGSLSKSLANADLHGDTYAVIFSERSQDRQLGKGDTAGTYGHDLDQDNRILHFKRLFCNQKERDSALEIVCENTTSWSNPAFDAEARFRMNKDIDYYSLVDKPWTLRIDFSNQLLMDIAAVPPIHDEDEEHILAMVANLFGHETFARPPARLLANEPNKKTLTIMQKLYLDMRAVVAKRSVAENSLFSIASMKSQTPRVPDKYISGPGTTDTKYGSVRPFIEHIMEELGVPATDIFQLVDDNPSYFAQMEILTKKLYQNPDFYTNLYDTPANVERKAVALQAVKLMQKFDMLKSHLRGEANVSILLEMAVEQLQREVEDQIQALGR